MVKLPAGRTALNESWVQVPSGEYQDQRVEVTGIGFRGFLNEQLIVERTNDEYVVGKSGIRMKVVP